MGMKRKDKEKSGEREEGQKIKMILKDKKKRRGRHTKKSRK